MSKFFGALTHFMRPDNSQRFFTPFFLVHTFGSLLIGLLSLHVLADLIEVFAANAPILTDPDATEEERLKALEPINAQFAEDFLSILGVNLVSLIFSAIMAASAQRHFIFGDAFSLNLAKDEFRIFFAWLAFVAVLCGVGIVLSLGGAIVGGILSLASPIFGGAVFALCGGLFAFAATKLSLTTPLIVRDNIFQFWRSIGESENKAGYLLASFTVYFVAYFLLSAIIDQSTPTMPEFTNPAFLIALLFSSALSAVFSYVYNGAIAYAVTVDVDKAPMR